MKSIFEIIHHILILQDLSSFGGTQSRQMDRQISDQFLKIASKVLIAPSISDF